MGLDPTLGGAGSKAPACTCGAKGPAGHARSCDLVAYALGRVLEAPKAEDGLGRTKGKPKTGATWRGVWVASELERDVLEALWKGRNEGDLLLRQPRFELWSSWRPGMGAPLRFTPDALVIRLASMERPLELKDGEPTRRSWALEVHEAKGPRKLESRDYRPRLAAFRATYPWLPVWVWRREGGKLLATELADLEDSHD